MDIDIIQRLLTLMDEGGLTELVFEKGDTKVKLSRRQGNTAPLMVPAPSAPAPVASNTLVAAPVPVEAAPVGVTDEGELFRSPTVGTYYSRPNPESPPFVSVGDSVEPESVLCIIEAMKVFNDIQAELSGQILEILVKDGETVQFDQPLFRISQA